MSFFTYDLIDDAKELVQALEDRGWTDERILMACMVLVELDAAIAEQVGTKKEGMN